MTQNRESIISDVAFHWTCVGTAVGAFYAQLCLKGVPEDDARFLTSDVLSHFLEREGSERLKLAPTTIDLKNLHTE